MNELISRRLKYAREKKGLTQARLSEKLGFKDRQTLAAIESGQRKIAVDERALSRRLIAPLSADLTKRFGGGFGARNLWQVRGLYLAYPDIVQTWSAQFDFLKICQTAFGESIVDSVSVRPHKGFGTARISESLIRKSLDPSKTADFWKCGWAG